MKELVKELVFQCREKNHDKVYFMQMYKVSGGKYIVEAQWGRREWGNDLMSASKTKTPTDFAAADKLFKKLTKEKERKGYLVFDDRGSLNVYNQLAF